MTNQFIKWPTKTNFVGHFFQAIVLCYIVHIYLHKFIMLYFSSNGPVLTLKLFILFKFRPIQLFKFRPIQFLQYWLKHVSVQYISRDCHSNSFGISLLLSIFEQTNAKSGLCMLWQASYSEIELLGVN